LLEAILGNATAERVLLYLENYEEGYAQAIADTFEGVNLRMVQVQLARFERGGVLVSARVGRTRLFSWNPRFAFRRELRALLRRALDSLPESERKKFFMQRRRPRRAGKPA
jgi:DNA-binding transcriptional ArsR family regulator